MTHLLLSGRITDRFTAPNFPTGDIAPTQQTHLKVRQYPLLCFHFTLKKYYFLLGKACTMHCYKYQCRIAKRVLLW